MTIEVRCLNTRCDASLRLSPPRSPATPQENAQMLVWVQEKRIEHQKVTGHKMRVVFEGLVVREQKARN